MRTTTALHSGSRRDLFVASSAAINEAIAATGEVLITRYNAEDRDVL